jgi:dienelactone hydrolase
VQTWLLDGRKIELVLSEPVGSRPLPAVVYLPGLGESASAGDAWRNAWAAAGYAVVSVQPLAEDEQAWRSELARGGEFKALGRERYAAAATRERLDLLAAIASEAQRRSHAGEAGWSRIDWNRVVIAGFDLGAYSAIAMAASAAPLPPRAVLALSPYASVPVGRDDLAEPVPSLPLLAVSGDADGDPLGVVAPGAHGHRLLDRLSGPDHYVLLMGGLTHARLSGTAAFDKVAESRASHPTPELGPAGDKGAGRSGRGRRTSSGDTDRNVPVRDAGRSPDGDLSLAEARERMARAVQVSTAFLDAYAKDDARARAWLATSAPAWLGASGELRRAQQPVAPG